MDDATLRKFNRAVELWRRQCRANMATKDMTQGLLDQLTDAGFTVQESVDAPFMVSALVALGYTVTPPDAPVSVPP